MCSRNSAGLSRFYRASSFSLGVGLLLNLMVAVPAFAATATPTPGWTWRVMSGKDLHAPLDPYATPALTPEATRGDGGAVKRGEGKIQ